jgi:hypothetical protein
MPFRMAQPCNRLLEASQTVKSVGHNCDQNKEPDQGLAVDPSQVRCNQYAVGGCRHAHDFF